MCCGFDSGCEHSKWVFMDETTKDTEVCLCVSGADIHEWL